MPTHKSPHLDALRAGYADGRAVKPPTVPEGPASIQQAYLDGYADGRKDSGVPPDHSIVNGRVVRHFTPWS